MCEYKAKAEAEEAGRAAAKAAPQIPANAFGAAGLGTFVQNVRPRSTNWEDLARSRRPQPRTSRRKEEPWNAVGSTSAPLTACPAVLTSLPYKGYRHKAHDSELWRKKTKMMKKRLAMRKGPTHGRSRTHGSAHRR